ncbi:cytoplasmic dynein 2 intermediate chain 1 isoform X2 [Pristis pectinata]|uniref:cytoplasmic dynein 2 intermediate chain 1 isoform X2 n=1 Tax=Pristis pectinata TaxID=685728 RepID=UPI00223D0955|nr:cytoplasmic dynein 2 intermediate chain 1 isoform X2 [Pristis pectinata]
MKPSKGKTKEDTWKTEELLKYIKAAQGDHPDDSDKKNAAKKRHKEDELEERRHRDRDRDRQKDRNDDKVRSKEKESDGDRHKDLEREKVHKKVKDEERDKDRGKKKERESEKRKDGDRDNYQGGDKNSGRRVRDEDKERDLNIERSTKREYESERHRDKERDRKKEQGKHREIGRENDGNGDQQSKHRQKKDKGNLELSKDDRYEEKERRHREQKEKERRNAESNEESKEKKRRSSDFRDGDYEWRHREHKDHGHRDGHREKRRKDREEPGLEARAEEMERKHRERKVKESKEDKRKHQYKDTKDPDREWEHKEREKRDLERREDRERKHRLKKGREEQERHGEYKEQSGRRKREQRSVPEFTDESRLKGITGNQEKPAGTLSEEGTGRLQSTWRSSQVTLSDDDLVEGEEIVMESKPAFESSNYEDDFEDYEDDFEEGECEVEEEEEGEEKEQEKEEIPARQRAEIEAIQKAITAENEKISATWIRSNQKTNEEEPKKDFEESQSRGPVRGTYIDFVAAKQREISSKVACKQKKRSAELLRLIDLDFSVNFSMLDLPPLNEYDVYIKSFGRTNTKQAFVQSNEDDVDQDIQTDEIETVDKWTQHPGEGSLVCGGANVSDTFSSDSLIKNIDSQRLTNFLRSACQVIAVLLEEDQVEDQASKNIQSKAASLSVSDRCSQLNTNMPFLHGREVLCLHFSQVQRQTLLSVHSLPKEPGMVQVASYYIICVWNIWEPSFPQKVLICESEVQCCCFGPGNVLSVFAGTVDGSIVAWDLRECSVIHYNLQVGGQEWTLRFPTFTTDGILTAANHACAVKAIDPVSSASYDDCIGLSLLTSQQGSSGLSFQLASLDESGLLNLWVVVELQKADLAGSLTDLGLIPGGKMKLIHSSAIDTISFFPRNLLQLGRPRTLSIKFLPSDPNHFFIGTDIGLVSRGTRHGLQAAPRLYKPQTSGAGPVQVTCIDFCHFGKTMFLVGCSDGTIRLHSVTKERPILQWNESTQGNPIQNLLWALTRPGMFFVLDTASHVYVWDLLQDVSKPVAEESLQNDRIATMAILGDPEKPSASSGLMLAKQSGAIEMQYLQKKWSEPHLNELETLHYLLQKTV